jgi:hypothetical protein
LVSDIPAGDGKMANSFLQCADLPAVLYNHNMCNKLLCYQSSNTDCIAENLLEIYIMSLMSLMSLERWCQRMGQVAGNCHYIFQKDSILAHNNYIEDVGLAQGEPYQGV